MSEIQYTTKDSNPHEQIGWLTTGIRIALMDLRAELLVLVAVIFAGCNLILFLERREGGDHEP